MPRDKTESHERLLEAAKKEFMEYYHINKDTVLINLQI